GSSYARLGLRLGPGLPAGGSNPQDPAALIRSGQPCTGLATAVTDMQAGLMLAAAAAFTRQLVLTMGPGTALVLTRPSCSAWEEFVDAATQALAGLASAPRPFTATQPGDVSALFSRTAAACSALPSWGLSAEQAAAQARVVGVV
ncbi:hypothetical protein HaLaN_13976, partial [Haematococcus lacustris]